MKTITLFLLLLLPAWAHGQQKADRRARASYKTDKTIEARPAPLPDSIDVKPSFAGGPEAWRTFLQTNIRAGIVAEAQDSTSLARYGSRQKVQVRFTVCTDGSLCDFSCTNRDKVSPEAAAEALRVMRKSPNWTPGRKNNQPVKVWYTQPITFVFED